MQPFVSIIIPCRNEEKYIEKCLNSIIANDYPKVNLELLVVDGMSTDKTREIITEFTKNYPFIKLLDNPKKFQPTALNIGIRNAKGEIIMRMDAHSIYPLDYISNCVKYLFATGADNVGGIWITSPGNNNNNIATSIAFGLSSAFGVGNAYFRIDTIRPKEVDTVPFGCYKKEVFDKIGLFDEEIIGDEDGEFNYRLRKNGGRIILIPEIKCYYYARSTLKSLCKQYFRYGFWKVRVFQKHPGMMQLRQFVPLTFVLGLLVSLMLGIFNVQFRWFFLFIILTYFVCTLYFSFQIATKHGWHYFCLMPLVFATLHFSYGIGFLIGLVRFAGRWKK